MVFKGSRRLIIELLYFFIIFYTVLRPSSSKKMVCYSCKGEKWCDDRPFPVGKSNQTVCQSGQVCASSSWEEWSWTSHSWEKVAERRCAKAEGGCEQAEARYARTDRKKRTLRKFECELCDQPLCNAARGAHFLSAVLIPEYLLFIYTFFK